MASSRTIDTLSREVFVPGYKKHIGVDRCSNLFKIRVRPDFEHVAAGKFVVLKLFKKDASVAEEVQNVKVRETKVVNNAGLHDFIVRFYGMYMDQGQFVGLIYEYSELGHWEDFLYEYMMDNQRFFAMRCFQACCIARALDHLKTKSIVHGDVFIENALIFAPELCAKLSNFGSAFITEDTQPVSTSPFVIDDARALYEAPEKRLERNVPSTHASDVYSFGIMLYIAFFQDQEALRAYADDLDLGALRTKMGELQSKNGSLPPGIINIICSCVRKNARNRMNIRQVLLGLESVIEDLAKEVVYERDLLLTFLTKEAKYQPSADIAFHWGRPVSIASQFSGQGFPQPVSGGLVLSPLSPFPDKRFVVDPVLQDFERDEDFTFQSIMNQYYNSNNNRSANVEHKAEDVDPSKLPGPEEKPTDAVIKSIMHHADIQKKWRTVLLHLGLKESDIRMVESRAKEHKQLGPEVDKSAIVHYALDNVWLENKFETATRYQLLDALMKSQCYDSAVTFVSLDYELD